MTALVREPSVVPVAWRDRWFPVAALALVVASDYRWRTRDPSQALSGAVDAGIVVELAVYGLVAVGLVLGYRGPAGSRRPTPPTYFACCFTGLMALSVTYTPYWEYALVRVAQMGVLVALVLVAVGHAERAHLHRFAHGFLVLVAASVIYGVLVPSEPVSSIQEGRFTWLALHPVRAGAFAGLATIVAVAYALAGAGPRPGPRWPRPAYVVLLGIVGGGLLAAHTRGAVLGTAVGVLVLVSASRRGRARLEAVVATLVLACVPALTSSGSIGAYFLRDASAEQLATLNSRTGLWEVAIEAAADRPLFGYGVNAAQGIFYTDTGLGGGHNIVVNVVVELGLVGLVVFVGLAGSVAVGVARLPTDGPGQLGLDRALVAAVLAFLLVNGIFFQGASATTNVASTWLHVCVAWVVVAHRRPAGGRPAPAPARRRIAST